MTFIDAAHMKLGVNRALHASHISIITVGIVAYRFYDECKLHLAIIADPEERICCGSLV
jgi:hypothetical protein